MKILFLNTCTHYNLYNLSNLQPPSPNYFLIQLGLDNYLVFKRSMQDKRIFIIYFSHGTTYIKESNVKAC